MPVAYVSELGATVARDGRQIIVRKQGRVLASWRVAHIEGLVLLGPVNVTSHAARLLLRAGIATALLRRDGRLLGTISGPLSSGIDLRLAQYGLARDQAACLSHSRAIVAAKINAMRQVLRALASNYPSADIRDARAALERLASRAAHAPDVPHLLGIEGAAAAVYFPALASGNRSPLAFAGRSSRPPRDPVNAMLSFGYSLLTAEIHSLLEALGFDPYLGIYHQTVPGRPNLALDLIEPFRHAVIDRLVLRAVNLGRFAAGDFEQHGDRGIRLKTQALRKYIAEYEAAMLLPACDPQDGCRRPARDILRRRCEHLRRSLLTAARQGCPPHVICYEGQDCDQQELA